MTELLERSSVAASASRESATPGASAHEMPGDVASAALTSARSVGVDSGRRTGPFPSEPIRIGFVEGNADGTIGGSYYSLLFLVESLDRTRYAPVVMFRRDHALRERFQRVSPVHIVSPRPAVRTGWPVVRRLINAVRFVQTIRDQARFLRQERLRLLHLNNSVTRNHDWVLAARLAGIPCITHERGINPDVSKLARLAGSTLVSIICISEAVREHLEKMGFDPSRLRVIHNGLDPHRVQPGVPAEAFRREHGIPPGHRVIGMLGNVKRWKGQEVVIRALPAIVQQCPNLTCLFVGDTSPADVGYEAELHRLVASLGLEKHVVFTGFCANVGDPLSVMEVAIHASVNPEPFGRVLLEAMAMGCPVVGSRDGAVPEIVLDGVTGRTFPPGDSSALAACVSDLLVNPEKARAFANAAFERLVNEFGVAQNVARTVAVYEDVLQGSGIARS